MNISAIFRPKPAISEDELKSGLRALTAEGVASMAMFSVTTSGILAAYALLLGANNFQIGILAAIPFILEPLQIPTIMLVERLRRRKLIVLATWFPSTLTWIPIALIPFFLDVPSAGAIAALLGLMCLRSVLAAATNCAWNSWMRDFIPQSIIGTFYSRKMALATVWAIIFGLAGAFFVQWWQGRAEPEDLPLGYTAVLMAGAIFLGLASPLFMTRVPEPAMAALTGPVTGLRTMLSRPIRDPNFRRLLTFLFSWGFAVNLAVPFFTIYMLDRLGFPLMAVIALNTLAQVTNMLFLRVWGPLADRMGTKTVLSVALSLYVLVILGWAFTTMPERYVLTVPLVIVLQVFAGIAAAGVNLTVGTIGLKLSPHGEATPFMAMASLCGSLGAGLGPIVGGRFIDFFSVRELTLTFGWIEPGSSLAFSAIHLTGADFLFAISFVLGLFTLRFLAGVHEEGAVEREIVLEELIAPTREMTRSFAAIPGMRVLGEYPFGYLRRVPGLDVAVGVTAYQLATTMQTAAAGAATGRETVSGVADHIGRALTAVVEQADDVRDVGVELARNAVRGSMLSVGTATAVSDAGTLARGAVIGTLRTLGLASVSPADAVRGAVFGAVEGAVQAGVSSAQAAVDSIQAAVSMAAELGIPREEVEETARRAASDAANADRQ